MTTSIQPATIDACEQRIAELESEILEISEQLADESRRAYLGDDYDNWASKARRARTHKVTEVKQVRVWRNTLLRRRQDEESLRRAEELQQQREARRLADMERTERLRLSLAAGQVAQAQREALHAEWRESIRRAGQTYAAAGEVDRLLCDLFRALGRLYRTTGTKKSDDDAALLSRAAAYLTAQGLLAEVPTPKGVMPDELEAMERVERGE